jgi:hypothetical protein
VAYLDSARPGILLDVAKNCRGQLIHEGIFNFMEYEEVFVNIETVGIYILDKRKVEGDEADRIQRNILRIIENREFDPKIDQQESARQTHAKRRKGGNYLKIKKGKMQGSMTK